MFLLFYLILKKELKKLKFKRVILPGLDLKLLRPVSGVLLPLNFFVTSFALLLIAQLVYSLKGILSHSEMNKLPSVQFYSKFFISNYYVNSLLVFYSIAETVGFDLELLITLSSKERINFVSELQNRILSYSGSVKIVTDSNFLLDPFILLKHRKALSLKLRSFMLLTCIFSPSSLVINYFLSDVGLFFILDSNRLFWSYIGLDLEDFNFLFFKFVFSNFSYLSSCFAYSVFFLSEIIKNEFKKFSFFNSSLVFSEDNIVLKSENNLTNLEREVKFVVRPFPFLSSDVFLSSCVSEDLILRAAYEQRVKQRKKVISVFNRIGKFYNGGKVVSSGKFKNFEKGAVY